MAKTIRYHERRTKGGWPMFTGAQTDNRFALCKKALCPDRSLIIKLKDCYQSEEHIQKFCKLRFLSEEYFDHNTKDVKLLPWGGTYTNHKYALEGAFYPFVRCVQRTRPIDTGIIWIGTKHEYPRVWVDNRVANWLCPYSRAGHVMTEPFEPLYRVLDNWARLSDRRFFPFLDLPPVPDL